MTEIYAVRRLKAIKPGECLRYYRGNFAEDIARCEKDNNDNASPQYAKVLKAVRETAESLQTLGRITIKMEKVGVRLPGQPGLLTMTDYIAVAK